jgi:DNA repair/transcription protein MET18/MMS19
LVVYLTRRLGNTDQIHFRAGVRESADALSALISHDEGKKFTPGDSEAILKGVFAVDKNGLLKDIKPSGRLALYDLVNLLMKTRQPAILRDMGRKEFTEGLVSMVELEKDPTNLKVIFQMFEDLSRNWELDTTALLNIWESYSRYFPITLARRAVDPSVPTPDELRALLLKCFVSNDFYATVAFPRLIDMLDTNQDLSANVKVIIPTWRSGTPY